jgi:hypothetical protein
MEQQHLINEDILLEKFPGKGGWTFARLPGISKDKHRPFGTRKVRGFIDSYEVKDTALMPMKEMLFITVRAEIRKQIGKQAGDYVRIVLYDDSEPVSEIIPEDFIECLKDEPAAWASFQKLNKAKQEECFQWLMESPVVQTRIQRMADAITNLASGLPFHAIKR